MNTFMSDSAEYETLKMSLYNLMKKIFWLAQGENQKITETEFQRQLTLYINFYAL